MIPHEKPMEANEGKKLSTTQIIFLLKTLIWVYTCIELAPFGLRNVLQSERLTWQAPDEFKSCISYSKASNYQNSSWKLRAVSTILLPRNKSILLNISLSDRFPSWSVSDKTSKVSASSRACRGFLGSMYICSKPQVYLVKDTIALIVIYNKPMLWYF